MKSINKLFPSLLAFTLIGGCLIAVNPPPENQDTLSERMNLLIRNAPPQELGRLTHILKSESHMIQDVDRLSPNPQQEWAPTLRAFTELDPDNQLFIAVQVGSCIFIELALENGANIDIRYSNARRTMLHLAAARGYTRVVQYFLEDEGFDIEALTFYDDTPLHAAVEAGRVDVVRLLLRRGANPNAINIGRLMPLHFAARGGSAEIVNLLIEYNADRDAQDQNGRTPQDHARTHYEVNQEIVRLLEPPPIPQLDPGSQQHYRNAIDFLDGMLEGAPRADINPFSGM